MDGLQSLGEMHHDVLPPGGSLRRMYSREVNFPLQVSKRFEIRGRFCCNLLALYGIYIVLRGCDNPTDREGGLRFS